MSFKKRTARFFSGPVMFIAGLNHFLMPSVYDAIIPDALPNRRGLTYLSGAMEMASAIGTMIPSTRKTAGLLLMATLIAVFPANVQMALNADRYPAIPGGRTTLAARLPLQVLFIYWAWIATRD